MSQQALTDIVNIDQPLNDSMESKRKKLHPAPEEEEIPSKKRKTSHESHKSSKGDKENISVNREEGEITMMDIEKNQDEDLTTIAKNTRSRSKSKTKSASKKASRSKSNSKAKSKSKSKSRTAQKSKSKVLEMTEEEDAPVKEAEASEAADGANNYSLRPRKNVTYSDELSLSLKKSSDLACEEDKEKEDSDMSFRLDQEINQEEKDSEGKEGETEKKETEKVDNVTSNDNAEEGEVTEVLTDKKTEEKEEGVTGQQDGSDEEKEETKEINAEELKDEIKELQGNYLYFNLIIRGEYRERSGEL